MTKTTMMKVDFPSLLSSFSCQTLFTVCLQIRDPELKLLIRLSRPVYMFFFLMF